MPGRHYLIACEGRVTHDPRSCYLRTKAEAELMALQLNATYREPYTVVDAEVSPTCEHSHPYNGSHCERPHRHRGQCYYTESTDGKRRRWSPRATPKS